MVADQRGPKLTSGATRVGARRWVVAEATLDAYVVAHTSKGNVVPMTTTRSA